MHSVILRRPGSVFNLLDDFCYPQWGYDWSDSKYPAVDIREKENEYILTAELPGVTEQDIEIDVDGSQLTIRSNVEGADEKKSDAFLIRERKSMNFSRTFALSEKVDIDRIEATFNNGILTIIAQKKEAEKMKRIEIKIGDDDQKSQKKNKKGATD